MGSAGGAYIWSMRAVFVVAAISILTVQLIPLETMPRRLVMPDLLVALTFAWVARRPELAPVVVIGGVLFLADLLMQRPPGLWAAIVIIGSEVLRARNADIRDVVFAVEWLTVAITIAASFLAYLLIMAIIVPYDTSEFLILQQMVLTILSYPLVVGFSHLVFGVRKAAPGEVDDQGRRL